MNHIPWPHSAPGQIALIAVLCLVVTTVSLIGLRRSFRSQWLADPEPPAATPQPAIDRTATWAIQPTGAYEKVNDAPHRSRHRLDDLGSHTTRLQMPPRTPGFTTGRATVYKDADEHSRA